MAKYKAKYFGDEFELLRAVKFCYDKGIFYYPVVISGQTKAMKFIPKVNIEMRQGSKLLRGTIEYSQGDELYDKIYELYMHKYEQLNKK